MSKLAPTAKVSAVGGSGVLMTVVLQLLQQYAPGLSLPSASTIAAVLTVLVTVAGWITKEDPALTNVVHELTGELKSVEAQEPFHATATNLPVEDWGKP
jgi:hypothetical protein